MKFTAKFVDTEIQARKMKVYDFDSILKDNGIENPSDSQLYHIVDMLESIGIKIQPNGPWVAGGAVLRTFMGLTIDTDLDIFFPNEPSYLTAKLILEKNAKSVRETKFSNTFEFLTDHFGKEIVITIQLVKYVYGDKISNIIQLFDLSICQLGFDGERIVCPEESIEDLRRRRMTILVENITHPGSTFKRIIKYVGRGFYITNENLQEFADNWIVGEKERFFENKY